MICAICSASTNRVICVHCDHKLASVGDNADWLRQAADWLEGKTLTDELAGIAGGRNDQR